jgi:pimeloyl-ACP methyl ester carboxylesterase
MTDHLFVLPDGRKLGYALYGPGDAAPVFYFHGTPSSRLEPLLLAPFNKNIAELCIKNNIKLIAVDRPGIGNSTFNPTEHFFLSQKIFHNLLKRLRYLQQVLFPGQVAALMPYHRLIIFQALSIGFISLQGSQEA